MQISLSSYHLFFGRQRSFGTVRERFYQGNQFVLLFEKPHSRAGSHGFDIFYTRVIDYLRDRYIVLYSCEELTTLFGRRAKENVWVLSRTLNQGEASLQNIEKAITSYTHVPRRRLMTPQKTVVNCLQVGF